MTYDIRAEVLDNTENCNEEFSCLQGKKECLCEVEDSFNDRILFVRPRQSRACMYRMSFGYSYVCNCPTRRAIYRNYKI
jgi:hypothetical protein